MMRRLSSFADRLLDSPAVRFCRHRRDRQPKPWGKSRIDVVLSPIGWIEADAVRGFEAIMLGLSKASIYPAHHVFGPNVNGKYAVFPHYMETAA